MYLEVHFDDEVLSWHHVNGKDGEDNLPTILITTENPHFFHVFQWENKKRNKEIKNKMIIIPIRKVCKTNDDVIKLIEKITVDLAGNKGLKDFAVVKELKSGKGKAILDSLILQPNFAGVGVDLEKLKDFLEKINFDCKVRMPTS